jgi:hypothetical protein
MIMTIETRLNKQPHKLILAAAFALIVTGAAVSTAHAQSDEENATFTVTKEFTDGNPAGVDVTLNCFQGLPITQTQTVSQAQSVEFTVQSFESGQLDCNLTEDGAAGYTASYNEEYRGSSSSVNCSWQDLNFGSYECFVTNTPDWVEVTVSKEWVIEGESVNYIDSSYYLELVCDNEIEGGDNRDSNRSYYYDLELNDGDNNGTSDVDYTAEVIPDWDGGTNCYVNENSYDSAIESSDNCSALHINLIEDETDVRSCTVTNSVFFEGIPSLNQYGLAILALLMLSVGFVGFRRFV